MALKNYQYDSIMRDYNRLQIKNRHDMEERQREAQAKIPRLAEIDREIAEHSGRRIRAVLMGSEDDSVSYYKTLSSLSSEREDLLEAYGYPRDYLQMRYTCPTCEDTGYVDGKKCACFRHREIELLYDQSNLRQIIKTENFKNFSFDYYSDTITDEVTGKTARSMAQRAYDAGRDFVAGFKDDPGNMYIYGDTGVGKSFLSHCIAKELLEQAYFVLYFSAHALFEHLSENAFSRTNAEEGRNDLVYDCDLLIIDDLGTELTNSFVTAQLFMCLNERIMRRKSTIISTNLSIEDFSQIYSERTFSRIAGNFNLVKLIGDDIRIKKL